MTSCLFAATVLAGFIYAVTPGPAFLAVFALSAQHGRTAGARFLFGHLAGDMLWGGLALAAIVGVNEVGPALCSTRWGSAAGSISFISGAKAVLSRGATTELDRSAACGRCGPGWPSASPTQGLSGVAGGVHGADGAPCGRDRRGTRRPA